MSVKSFLDLNKQLDSELTEFGTWASYFLSSQFRDQRKYGLVLFYSFKNYGKERLIVNYLSGSFFCRAEISKVYGGMVVWRQPGNFQAERLLGSGFCIVWRIHIQTVKQRSEEGFSVCFFAFRKKWENATNNISSLWFEVSNPGVGGGK